MHPLDNASLATRQLGPCGGDAPLLVLAHGWANTHAALLPVAQSLQGKACCTLFDFPGFGASPRPAEAWGTADYADRLAGWLKPQPGRCKVWVGHSFGARVGVQIAARHPGLLAGLVLISAAGLRRRRTPLQRLRLKLRTSVFKTGAGFLRDDALERWRQRFGSRDYLAAGAMRPIFVKVVSEDLAPVARSIRCPVLLVYGANDDETPPGMGEDYRDLIPGSELTILSGYDHHSILDDGRHQTARLISGFLDKVCI